MQLFRGALTNFFKKILKKHNAEKKEQISSEDIVIGLVGVTGSGKSTFLEHATGHTGAVEHKCIPQNAKIQAVKMTQTPAGRSIWLVDTPGFNSSDYKFSEPKVLRSLLKFLDRRCSEPRQLDGLLYFHSIASGRIEGEASSKAIEFRRLMRGHLRNVVLVTTFWGDIRPEECGKNEQHLEDYWQEVGGGARQHRFYDTPECARQIVQMITPL